MTPRKLFMHTVTHEYHHKGQIMAMDRQLGYEPPNTDVLGTRDKIYIRKDAQWCCTSYLWAPFVTFKTEIKMIFPFLVLYSCMINNPFYRLNMPQMVCFMKQCKSGYFSKGFKPQKWFF